MIPSANTWQLWASRFWYFLKISWTFHDKSRRRLSKSFREQHKAREIKSPGAKRTEVRVRKAWKSVINNDILLPHCCIHPRVHNATPVTFNPVLWRHYSFFVPQIYYHNLKCTFIASFEFDLIKVQYLVKYVSMACIMSFLNYNLQSFRNKKVFILKVQSMTGIQPQ